MSDPRPRKTMPASSLVVTMPPEAVRQVIVDSIDGPGNVMVTHVADAHVGFGTGGSWRTYADVDAIIKAERD